MNGQLPMRTKYQQFFKKNEMELREIWGKASIVFDANCLLNLYRYSESAKDEFLNILVKLEKRIWLPEQAASEFFQNRLSEISKQSKTYDENIKLIDNLKDNLSNNRGHPFLPKKQLENFLESLEFAKQNFNDAKEKHLQKLTDDDVLSSLSRLFNDRVGSILPDEKLNEVMEKGPDRMKAQIPPGFKDYPKHKDPKSEYEKKANFGDLILWMQLIENAKTYEKPIILVTDDWKEDWWEQVHGRTIGPRPELIHEFLSETSQDILIYRSEQFLKYAKVHLNAKISDDTLSEVKDAQRRKLRSYSMFNHDVELENFRRNKYFDSKDSHKYNFDENISISEGVDDRLPVLREKLKRVAEQVIVFEQRLKDLQIQAHDLHFRHSENLSSEEISYGIDQEEYSVLMQSLSEEANELEKAISKLNRQKEFYMNMLSSIEVT